MKQKVKSNFEEKMEQNLKNCYEKKIEKYKKEHEKKEIESEKSIEEQLKELMEAYYNDLEIDYEALFKALTKNS